MIDTRRLYIVHTADPSRGIAAPKALALGSLELIVNA